MAISTSTEALIAFQKRKIEDDKKQKQQIIDTAAGYEVDLGDQGKFILPGIDDTISWYDAPIQKIDTRIEELNAQIVSLHNQILAVGQNANSCGCGGGGLNTWEPNTEYTAGEYVVSGSNLYLINADGTSGALGTEPVHETGTVGIYDYVSEFTGGAFLGTNAITVSSDTVTYRGYGYTPPNPFSAISGTLTSSNVGVGTELLVGSFDVGTYYGDIGVARTSISNPSGIVLNPICPGITTCDGYPPQVTNLANQIPSIRAERDNLITKTNYLKAERARYRLRKYGFDLQVASCEAEIAEAESLVSFLEDDNNSEWL